MKKKCSKSFDKKISSGIRLLFDIRIYLNTVKKNTGLVEVVGDGLVDKNKIYFHQLPN